MKKGILFIIVSGLCFMVVNFFVKILGTSNAISDDFGLQQYGAHELVFFRSLISLVLTAYLLKRKGLSFWGNNKKWLLVRGFAGVSALCIFFFTLQNLPLAVASIVQYLSPIFTILLAIAFLKERIFKWQWLFISLAFCGVIMMGIPSIINRSEGQVSLMWLGLGVLSSFFAAIAYLAIIKLKETDTPLNIVLYFPLVSLPIMGVWCLFDFVMPVSWEWLILLVIGIFTQFAQILMTKALHCAEPGVVVPFKYLGAFYAFTIGFFVFDEELNLILYIALTTIIISVISNAIYKNKMKMNL
ncbi:MAG: drug/metabolite transporter (DMT)-like permease [Lentimonas sp.]|jgi:drug/metabolite transporter (DMT)-like permease